MSTNARPRAKWNGKFAAPSEQHAEKRRMILREAAEAFNDRGYHNVSLDEVASRLGITKTVFYYYFRDKNHVLLSCVEIGFELAETAMAEAESRPGAALDRVVAFTRLYVEGITSDLGACAVLTDLTSLHPSDLDEVRARQRRFGRRLIRLVKAGVEDGSIEVEDPSAAVSWIVSAPLMLPRLTALWGETGAAWLADHYAEFTRRSLSRAG
ncbi:TetR/AcrR family transcriptional regulator [uncultured Albimonas sp.]|uniref:TetR/AcrR family transcriptional regulator n=1 Tax=uncultured Albimonas sp. TaxID=1331701 RepID=UPI0030EB230C|tara:strand:- start:6192 stop:6824 length:633 start_codon:yes stop_codon:yes gene_type:complete